MSVLDGAALTPSAARDALALAGVRVDARALALEAREDRWLVRVPGAPGAERLAWFAASPRGREGLARERRVLGLIAARCSFRVPRLVYAHPDGAFDLRAPVLGLVDPWAVYTRVCADPERARAIGRAVGAILAEQHTRITARDTAGWLPREVGWPEPLDSIRARLPRVIPASESALLAPLEALLARYEATRVTEDDRALVHGDVGFHNLVFDAETLAVRGVIDYFDAAWADRHFDFRYLLFDRDRPEMLDAALAVYEPAVGVALSRGRIALYNAVAAASFLAYRDGTAPAAKSCGRTLAEDLAWTRGALARAVSAGG